MKKLSAALILFFALSVTAFAQTAAPTDFYAGKWEIMIVGTPNGDAKMVTDLVRKDGKLTGELKDPTGQRPEPLPIRSIDETANGITINFEAQGMDLALDLAKVDDDHLKGAVMSFDATAVRVKE